MKCPHCGSEWNTSPQMLNTLKNCPFCGKTIVFARMENEMTLESVLCRIASEFGMEPLRNGHQMIGYFTDLAPDMSREYRMLRYFVEADCHTTLFSIQNAGAADQKLGMERAVKKMVDEYLIAEDVARTVCEAYWTAVGGKPVRRQSTDTETLKNVQPESAVQRVEPKHASVSASPMPVVPEKSAYQQPKPTTRFQIIQRKDYGMLRLPDGSQKVFYTMDSPCLYARFWTKIIGFSAGVSHLAGLKADGTVCVAGTLLRDEEIQKWSGMTMLASGASHTVGLCADGTVKALGTNLDGQCHTQNWSGITAIAAGANHSVGLCADGTVRSIGDNKHGQCNVRDWSEITAIAAGTEFTAGLRRDGTVVVAGSAAISTEAGSWKDMTAIAAGDFHIVGLSRNGTVKAVSSVKDLFNNRCNVKDWTNVTAIAADNAITVGLRSDGTVLSTNPRFMKRFP